MSLCLATPTAGDLSLGYVGPMLQTIGHFGARFEVATGSFLPRLRDMLCARFLSSGLDHMLCVDSDMTWTVQDVQKLLDLGVDFAAGSYSQKEPNGKLNARLAADSGDGEVRKAERAGTGFLLLSRACVASMFDRYSELGYTWEGLETVALHLPMVVRRKLVGEDYAMCARWRDMGGDIHLHSGVALGHVGQTTYRPNMAAILAAHDAEKG